MTDTTTDHLPDSSFGKIFQSMYTGSLFGAGTPVMALWPYIIANTRPPGVVEIMPKYVASLLGCDVDDVESAIEYLCQPDPHSRSQIADGRRLVKIEGQGHLYEVPTWNLYREKRDDAARKTYFREAKRREREKMSKPVKDKSGMSKTHGDCPGQSNMSTQAEAEAEAEADNTTSSLRSDVGRGRSAADRGSRPPASKKKPKSEQSEEEYIAELSSDPAYEGIDVPREAAKMLRWCKENNRQPTRRRLINWLNRAEKPLKAISPARQGQRSRFGV